VLNAMMSLELDEKIRVLDEAADWSHKTLTSDPLSSSSCPTRTTC